jgi:hypothetical protein
MFWVVDYTQPALAHKIQSKSLNLISELTGYTKYGGR